MYHIIQCNIFKSYGEILMYSREKKNHMLVIKSKIMPVCYLSALFTRNLDLLYQFLFFSQV